MAGQRRLGNERFQLQSIIRKLAVLAIGSNLLLCFTRVQKLSDYIIAQELVISAETEDDYSCYPPFTSTITAQQDDNHQLSRVVASKNNNTIIYLEVAWHNMHSETFYSYIHKLCSCDKDKDAIWSLDTNSIPHFYIGPENMVLDDLRRILVEFNNSACGPIFVGKPPIQNPHLTIFTTIYGGHFSNEDYYQHYGSKLNDTRYIFMCHEDVPEMERNPNVYWLTPRHTRYVVPSFFPPAFVERSEKRKMSNDNENNSNPILFLVMGSFDNGDKRNIRSLKSAVAASRDYNYNYTIRFLGGDRKNTNRSKELLLKNFPDDYDKIELVPNPDAYAFMENVAEADVVLPLVDERIFHDKYQDGKKLTSSVTWALGFRKKMILYRPLAEVFGVREDENHYWWYNDSETFDLAFRACLEKSESRHI